MFKRLFCQIGLSLLFGLLLTACSADLEATNSPALENTIPAPTLEETSTFSASDVTSPVPTFTFENTPPTPTAVDDDTYLGLSEAEVNSLLSLKQVEGYPLYTMHYYPDYEIGARSYSTGFAFSESGVTESWACSLFAALAEPEARLYGRNFDWEFSPAVLLFTHPADGYASVAMVDIAYLGFPGDQSQNLTEKPLDELVGLLNAPYIPFDGMNEAGLAIGMAAVPPGNVPDDPDKATLGSLGVIRAVLDGAANVDEALEIIQSYNIDFDGGPPIHYLIADAQGNAALLEYYAGEIHVLRNQANWHLATNFLNAAVDSPEGQCWRYDTIQETMKANQGALTFESALDLLHEVSQNSTQWSVVYGMSIGEVRVAMGRDYEQVHVFQMDMLGK